MSAEPVARPDPESGNEESWTILRMILWSADYLAAKGVENHRLDAEWLLARALGVERLQLYLQYDRPLSLAEREAFKPLLRRRAGREPLQYILGRTAFRELELAIEPGVLIPRPETEVLVEEVLSWARSRDRKLESVLDVGTGSGAVALSLALEGGCARVVATDVSQAALDLARENAKRHGVGRQVEFLHGSLFEPLEPGERFDVVVSNPPYIEAGEEPKLQPEVREWEPKEALFAGEDGLEVIRPLVTGAADKLLPGGLLALEVGSTQTETVAGLLEATGAFAEIRTRRDLSGRPRVVTAERR